MWTPSPWLLPGFLLILIGLAWWQTRSRWSWALLGSGWFMVGLGLVVSWGEDTPAAQVTRLTRLLGEQFQKRDPAVLEHFSPQASEWRQLCDRALQWIRIEDLRMSDFQTVTQYSEQIVVIRFRARATVQSEQWSGYHAARFELTWQRTGTSWKIVDVRRLHPVHDRELGLFEAQ